MASTAENGPIKEIVHVVNRFPPALGGMEKVVQALARAQHKLGIDVTVLTSDDGQGELPPEDEPFPVIRLRSFAAAHTQIIPGLWSRLFGIDRNSVLHLHVAAAYTPELVWIYSLLRKHRYVASVYLDVPPSGLTGRLLLTPYKSLLLKRVLRGAQTIWVPTEDYQDLISEKYGIPRSRIIAIRCGTPHRRAEQPKALSAEGSERRLLFVGRLAVQKNIPSLLEAISIYVRKYGSNVRLALAGDGELRQELETLVRRLELSGNVAFLGALHADGLEAAYEESDLLVLTSTQESFGLVFIEAMTKGVPIVSVDIPAVRNVVENGENGLLAEQTPEAVADAIHTLLDDAALYGKVSENNLAKAQQYDWDIVAKEFMSQVYGRLSG